MGLLTALRKEKRKEKTLRVLVLGLDNAGKSTVVARLLGAPPETVAPTFGFVIKTLFYRERRLDLWDVGGQKSIRPYWQNCFEKTDVLLWVIDSNDLVRVETSRSELIALFAQQRIQSTGLLVLANKQDREKALTPKELEVFLGLGEKQIRKFKILATSGLTGTGMEQVLEHILCLGSP